MKKTIELGLAPIEGYKQRGHAVIEIELKEEKKFTGKEHVNIIVLSMTGSVRVGRSWSQGGQCQDTIKEMYKHDKHIQRMCEIWDKYHLNDLKPGCVHQDVWVNKKITITTYRLHNQATRRIDALKERVLNDARDDKMVKLHKGERILLGLKDYVKTDKDIPIDIAEFYEVESSEEKTLDSLYEKEHPEGWLCKPCPICGYEYGTAWTFREIPAEIIEEIKGW